MAKIGNDLQAGYNYEQKKTKNLTFSKGEIFSGRIVDKGGNTGEIILRIGDRWQVKANVKDSTSISEGNHKFKVVGYEDETLQLEVVDEKAQGGGKGESQLDDLVKKFGLKDEDKNMLMEFVKEGVPLTKDNILNAKNILHLSEQLKNGNINIDELVNKFLEGKNISLNTPEGQELAQVIKDALNNLKGISRDEILFMLENNLDFTKEGIESLKNILNKNNTIFNNLKEILTVSNTNILETDFNTQVENNFDLKLNSLLEKYDLTKLDLSNISDLKDINSDFLKEFITLLKGYNVDSSKNLLYVFSDNKQIADSLMDMVKSDNALNIKDTSSQEILKNLNIEPSKENLQTIELLNNLKGMLEGKDLISITSARLKEAGLNSSSKEGQAFSKDFFNLLRDLNDETISDVAKEIFSKSADFEGNVKFLKSMESDLKSLLSKDDFTLKVASEGQEPKELITKNTIDILKEFGMKVSKANVELVDIFKQYKEIIENKDVNTAVSRQLESNGIDPASKEGQAFIKDLSSFLNNIKSSSLEKFISNVSNMKDDELKNTLGFLKDIKDSIFNRGTVDASSKAASIKDDMVAKLNLMKDMITTLASKDTTSMQFLTAFKGAISDFKIFNELSGNYYMVDVPLNWNEEEKGCKLIIKDDRKSGKKIDSNNIKIVATVNTINMGDVDAYIRVSDKDMHLELKAEEEFTKFFELSKDVVKSALMKIGYNPIVSVSKRRHRANIVEAKEFFEEINAIGINTRV